MASATRTRDWAEVDFYRVLGVEADATDDDIARAYRTLAKQLHPDSGATVEQVERFKDVSNAYMVLGDGRIRRDYDRVRALDRVGVAAGPAPAFKAAKARRSEFTRRRAWMAVIAGIVTTLAGIGVAFGVWTLRQNDADERAATVAIDAVRTEIDGGPYVTFAVDGERFRVPEPEREEPGGIGSIVEIRYDPNDPTRVVADEDRFPRDITLAIVALKMLVGGPVITVLGIRRIRAAR